MSTQQTIPVPPTSTPGIRVRSATRDRSENRIGSIRRSRFVMQSHLAGARAVSAGAIFVAATIAVGLYLIGRRLSE
jgi:hypothetical protein